MESRKTINVDENLLEKTQKNKPKSCSYSSENGKNKQK